MVNSEGCINPSNTGLPPDATFCKKDYRQTGVSVSYAFSLGVEGKVARVAGQQRIVVETDGLLTTVYIPSAFLKILD